MSVSARAARDSLRKLDPRHVARNPVMFVVEIGALATTLVWIVQAFGGSLGAATTEPAWVTLVVSLRLWLTVVFGNFAEAIAEGRGQAKAATWRARRSDTAAKLRDGAVKPASELTRGDLVVVTAGEVVPGD